MVQASTETILIDAFGAAIADIIRDGTAGTQLKSVSFGSVDHVAFERLDSMLPACFVRPGDESLYQPMDLSGSLSRITESVRIQVVRSIDPAERLYADLASTAKKVIEALRDDRTISRITDAVSHQIIASNLSSVEWTSPENQFLISSGASARAVVLRWDYEWITRCS